MVGPHGRLMGSTLAPHGHPWLPRMVFCVNLNRNLTGQLGTYCKLTEPTLPFSGFKPPLDTLVAARAMPIGGEKVKVTRPRWLKRAPWEPLGAPWLPHGSPKKTHLARDECGVPVERVLSTACRNRRMPWRIGGVGVTRF